MYIKASILMQDWEAANGNKLLIRTIEQRKPELIPDGKIGAFIQRGDSLDKFVYIDFRKRM